MRMGWRAVTAFGLILGLSSAVVAGEKATPARVAPRATSAGFEKMKTLIGDWAGASDGEGHDAKVQVSYALTSAGSAVIETLQTEHGTMVTMYHPDGEAVMMTHYCAAGNQPRMRAKGAGDKELAFSFVDATNLSSPEAMHMHDLKITFNDADHITQEWTTSAGGKKTPVVFKLERKK
jgi:hypothetical protein